MKRTLSRILIGLVIFLLLVGAVFGGYGFFTVRRSYPQVNGEIHLSGLEGPVDIYRDPYGIPQIFAASMHDLFFAQGYVHAQDRFWQMDFWRHIGSGRLSELFGKSQVETDTFLRTMGWARVAQQELESLDPESLAILDAYAQGVNAYLADHQGSALSLEYAILKLMNSGYKPEPWRPLHSLTWAKAMAWDLRGNMDEEMDRARLLKYLDKSQVDELYPPYPQDHPVIVSQAEMGLGNRLDSSGAADSKNTQTIALRNLETAFESVQTQVQGLNVLLGPAGSGIGSNNWVISGDLTATGKPLLANDPHLSIQMPSIWYEVGLHCSPRAPDCPLEVTGFSFAGAPGVIIGHNDRIAWGFTNLGPDVMDLYIEKVNPAAPNQYEVNGEWVDMDLTQETIQVAGGDPVELTVRSTRHGTVLWDNPETNQEFRQQAGIELPDNYALALRWTALEVSHTFPAIWKINLAQNWEEFRAAAAMFDVPSQNMVYADVDGNIGYQSPGKIPVRASGDGRLPVPGWTDDYEWKGYIPFEELPFAFNPHKGYIATANNAVVGPDYPNKISTDWNYGYRASRIVQMLENAPGMIDIPYIQKMQGDDKDLNAETLVPLLLQVPLDDPRLEKARSILDGWDYQDQMDSAPAALFNVFWKNLLAQTFHDDLPEKLWPSGGDRYFEIVRRLTQQPDSHWWDIQTTSEVETMETIFRQALSAAVDEIEALQGSDPARWNWGGLHTATFRNATLGESGIAPIEALFNRGPFPVSGGGSIVNATSWDALEPYAVAWLPSMRMIVDLGNLENSVVVNTTGQSGHAFHPNYVNMADLWRMIRYHPMLFDPQQIEAQAGDHLRLLP